MSSLRMHYNGHVHHPSTVTTSLPD
jgi:hypothetical protein